MNLEQKKVKSIKEFLIDHLSATLVYIFGSASSGNFRANKKGRENFVKQQ